LSRWVLDGCGFGFDVVANEEFLKFLADKFAAVVMTAFRGSWIVTEPLLVKLHGATFGVGGGYKCKFEPSTPCIYHRHHMDLVFDFVVRRFGADSNRQGGSAVYMYLFEWHFSLKGRYER
jgi:hypothetical protein